jgi:hypothetical protein
MVQFRDRGRAADPRAPLTSLVVWFVMAALGVFLVTLAVAAAESGGLDRLLPNDQPFVPYFTT